MRPERRGTPDPDRGGAALPPRQLRCRRSRASRSSSNWFPRARSRYSPPRMHPAIPDEDALEGLIGAVVPSEVVPGVGYRIVWRVGEGAMSVVFYAIRVTPEGEAPVVVKVLRPS